MFPDRERMRSFVEVQSAFSIIGTETGVRNVVVENSEEFADIQRERGEEAATRT